MIATFKEAGVRGRVRLLIEAESLLNDGTAAVAFVAVLGVLAGEHPIFVSITGILLSRSSAVRIIGAIIGVGFMFLAGRTPDYLVE